MPCNCIETVDALLATRNTRLTRALTFGAECGEKLMIQTELIEKKRGQSPVGMFPSFCPFCGEVYETAPVKIDSISPGKV